MPDIRPDWSGPYHTRISDSTLVHIKGFSDLASADEDYEDEEGEEEGDDFGDDYGLGRVHIDRLRQTVHLESTSYCCWVTT